MNSSQNKALFVFIVLVAFVDGVLVTDHFYKTSPSSTSASEPVILEDIFDEKSPETSLDSPDPNPVEEDGIPFTTQAPLGMWESPWSDYAEEACVWMAMKWVNQEEFESIYNTADELKEIGAWEVKTFGTSALTDIPQTLQTILSYFGHQNAFLSGEVTEQGMKDHLAAGAILIVPVNGQLLDNPNYGDPAPEHHMILICGSTETGFLTNDPGTRRGEAVVYETQKILDAIQDLEGERIMLVIQR